MDSIYDYKQFAILYVDDEEKSLKYFHQAFRDTFRILTAPSAQEGYALLQQHKDGIGLLMTDQRMPGEKGVWLLEKARLLRPSIVRILATAYSDMDAAIAAVNSGAIYKYVSKPWDLPQLQTTLKRGLEFFMVQRERDQLLHEKLSVLRNMMVADRIVSLGLLAAGLSHQIRNSLVAVKTFLDLAPHKLAEENVDVEGLRNPDFWKEYHKSAQEQINRITMLLNDLWTPTERNNFEFRDTVSLRTVVEETIAQLRFRINSSRLQVENLVPADLPTMQVDRPKFYRLFELLLKDQMVRLPAGSRLVLDASPASGPGGRPEILVHLSDNGPMLPKEALRLVFDPFVFRRDTPAEYAIHLMACYFIVHHHGGRIEANSEEGKGTTFTLRLPIQPEAVREPQSENDFLQKAMLSDALWQKLLTSD